MRTWLKQQGLWAPLTRKTMGSKTAEMAHLKDKAYTIMLCFDNGVIIEVADEQFASSYC